MQNNLDVQAPIIFTICPSDPKASLFDVTLRVANPDPAGQVFTLASWIPGSYMLRDFTKNIIGLTAVGKSGEGLNITPISSHSWQLKPYTEEVTLSYQVYAYDLSVRTAYLDTTRGFFNTTSTCFMVEGQRDKPIELNLEHSEFSKENSWQAATGMSATQVDSQGFGSYLAQSYDDLIEYPFELGHLETLGFLAADIPHKLVISGNYLGDAARLVKDLIPICEAQINFFGKDTLPFDNYTFLLHLTDDAYGGLEHTNSTALISPRRNMPAFNMAEPDEGYLQLLELCSHEYFHTWNVKQIKPQQFIKPDLTQAAHTVQLWWFEGATSYYDQLFLYKARIVNKETFLKRLATQLTNVYRMPGRLKLSVAESSYHAWTKFYQQDSNAPNAIISYYSKGALIVMALDLKIRKHTNNQKTLDDLMLLLWQEYGVTDKGLADGEIETLASNTAGTDLTDFFQTYLYGTKDLPLEELLETQGIKFSLSSAEENSSAYLTNLLGVNLKISPSQNLQLANVWHNSPSHKAGLIAGDEILALNSMRIDSQVRLEEIIRKAPAKATFDCVFYRRDQLLTTELQLGDLPVNQVNLEIQQEGSWPCQ